MVNIWRKFVFIPQVWPNYKFTLVAPEYSHHFLKDLRNAGSNYMDNHGFKKDTQN